MDVVVGRSCVVSHDGTSTRLPIAHIVCNQTPPVWDKPSLMTIREVEAVFHEFGHALQHMLTKQDEGLVSGSRGIEWDAVEIASQFMENWCYQRDTLMSIGKHYETGEDLTEEVCLKLLSARTFRAGSQLLRQWAEVLSADAFSAFEEVGLDNDQAVKEMGHKFRETILALGGGKSPHKVFTEFRGREASPDAFLRYNGLLPAVVTT